MLSLPDCTRIVGKKSVKTVELARNGRIYRRARKIQSHRIGDTTRLDFSATRHQLHPFGAFFLDFFPTIRVPALRI